MVPANKVLLVGLYIVRTLNRISGSLPTELPY